MKGRIAFYRIVAAGFAGWLGIAAARADAPPVAVAVHLRDEGDSAKLSFDLSAPVEARAREILDPDRIVVDFAEVNFQIDPSVGRSAAARTGALVKTFRFGLFGPGKSRVVIELARPSCVARIDTHLIAKGEQASRLSIELKACPKEAFAAAAKAHAPPPTAVSAAPAPEAAPAGPPVIVLDPGHGGVDGGAYGLKGTVEKTIVLEFAAELKRKLEALGSVKVLMTRDGDQFVSLEDRVAFARQANAALFISIHADTVPASADDVSGTTVYTCSDRASDAVAARIAARENAADRAAGVENGKDDSGVADILFDLRRRETRAYAHLFSRKLVSQWSSAGRLNHNPERSAGFVVLKAPDFPSVLVELGYLSNTRDIENLTSPAWRDHASDAMVGAIAKFFSLANPVSPALAASAPAQVK